MPTQSEHSYPGIYKFTNKENGKVYIGQSQNIYRRYCHHREMKAKGLLCQALKKYGIENFNFEVLEQVNDLSLLNEREQYWMDFYLSYDSKKGYNICRVAGQAYKKSQLRKLKFGLATINRNANAGRAGRKHSEETRRLLSEKATGRVCHPNVKASTSKTFKGQPKPAEQRAKMSKSVSKNIAQIEPSTNAIVRVWLNAQEIARETGLTTCTIRECCMGYYWDSRAQKRRERNGLYSGFLWRYATEQESNGCTTNEAPVEIIVEKRKKPVCQLDSITGEIIAVWGSLQAIEHELGFCNVSINKAIKFGEVYKNFKWQLAPLDATVTHSGLKKKVFLQRKSKKSVAQIEPVTGSTIKVWASAAEASRGIGVGETSITNACQGRYWDGKTKRFYPKDSHAGFKWEYYTG